VRVALRGGEAVVVEVGVVVVVVSAGAVVVSVLVVVAAAVLVVVDVVVTVVVVGALVVGSVAMGGASARAAAAAPLPKRTTVASVAISFWRAMRRDYRRLSNVLLYRPSGWRTIASPQLPRAWGDRPSVGRGRARVSPRPGPPTQLIARGRR
jgi:hypothetical protein